MVKRIRQAHLWIGLITSIFLLVEAVTGLLLAEPWLIGEQERGEHRALIPQDGASALPSLSENARGFSESAGMAEKGRNGGEPASLAGIIRGLHEGRIGQWDVSWAVDTVAIAMILLTVSGIYLSIRLLAVQRNRNRKRKRMLHTTIE
ncbi:hypothetical protein SAMN05192569_101062 [Parageobacillus thermantarcticus]|uniref:PepSY-associated TM region n=1 Tax=Parageobacillus thermantarcticus TaxID=186116 RepID=A0A1I0T2P8_9BACL|nr:hypothetical protein SAMN05192569_101062 [Parageobacillus thermantarcticus]